jgi:hypothetical protein
MGNSSASAERPKDIGSFKKQYEKYSISTAINQVHYGVCHGMCLNWVRKMLLTGPGWRPKKDKDYEVGATKLPHRIPGLHQTMAGGQDKSPHHVY